VPNGAGQFPPRLVQIASGAQVHYRIGPCIQSGPHLLDLIFDCRTVAARAYIGIDLRRKSTPYPRRLEIGFNVAPIGRYDKSAGRNFLANDLGANAVSLGYEFHLIAHATSLCNL